MSSSAVKERLRKLRQKYGLGEYRKASASKPRKVRRIRVRARKRKSVGGFSMARRGKRVSHKKGMLGGSGIVGLVRSAMVGLGSAHLAGYVPVNVPYKEEAMGAVGAYILGGKNIKSALVGAGAVYLTKLVQGNTGNSNVSSGNMN